MAAFALAAISPAMSAPVEFTSTDPAGGCLSPRAAVLLVPMIIDLVYVAALVQ